MNENRAMYLKDIPNMSKEVLFFLKSIIRKNDHILEFGSGGSTIWFSRNAGNVISFEHDIDWYKAVKKRLKELKLNNVDLKLETNYIFKDCGGINGMFDFILIDSKAWVNDKRIESRTLCTKISFKHIKKGGWLLLDDSSTAICKNAVIFMDGLGWITKEIDGIRMNINAKAWRKP